MLGRLTGEFDGQAWGRQFVYIWQVREYRELCLTDLHKALQATEHKWEEAVVQNIGSE